MACERDCSTFMWCTPFMYELSFTHTVVWYAGTKKEDSSCTLASFQTANVIIKGNQILGGGWEVFFPLSNVGKKDAPQCKINWLLDIISTKSTVGCRNLFMISYYPDVFCMSLLKVTILYIPGKVDSESYSYYQQICLFIYSIS